MPIEPDRFLERGCASSPEARLCRPSWRAPNRGSPRSSSPHRRHHAGKVIGSTVTPDLESGEVLFRISADVPRNGAGRRTTTSRSRRRPVAGLFLRPVKAVARAAQPGMATFIAVAHVEVASDRSGARPKVVAEPQEHPDAAATDPRDGGRPPLRSSLSAAGIPGDFLAAPGESVWSSLHRQGPEHRSGLLPAALRLRRLDLPNETDVDHVILSTGQYARRRA